MADQSLLARAGLDPAIARTVLADALTGADDGELFLEYRQSESLVFDNGRLKQAGTDNAQGFGLRSVKGEAVGYAHSSDVSEAALKRAAETVRAVAGGYSGTLAAGPTRSNVRLYADDNPLAAPAFGEKVKLLETIDAYARAKDPKVRQVTASLAASWQVVEIVRPDGEVFRDIRPLVRLNVSIVAGSGDRQEVGSHGFGGRAGYAEFITEGAGTMRSTRRCARRWSIWRASPPPPARWTWCSGRAGRASCCTRRWATAWKATSTARASRPSPA